MKRGLKIALWLLIVAYILFIFSNSIMNGLESSEVSTKVATWLYSGLSQKGVYMDYSLFHHYIRKLAHFTEFFGMGFLVTLACMTCPLFKNKILNFLLVCLPIPFIDEQIQAFIPDRSSSLNDVLIDGAGIVSGFLVGLILYGVGYAIYTAYQKHKAKEILDS